MSIERYQHLGLKFKGETEYKRKIRERDNYTCQLCGEPGYDVDHIIPWHISHDSSESNLRVLCHPCNLIGRRQNYTLPQGHMPTIPWDRYETYLKAELAACAP